MKPPIRNSLKRSARLFLQPAHHAAQLLAGLLELGVSLESTGSEELGTAACTVLLNPLGSEGTVLDLAQDLLHLLAGLLGDDALAGAVIAVLSGVGDGVTHLSEAALVDQSTISFIS